MLTTMRGASAQKACSGSRTTLLAGCPPRHRCVAPRATAEPAAAPTADNDLRWRNLKVLVAGATGGTGSCVVTALRAKGVPVRALVRDAAKAASKLPAPGDGLQIVEGDVVKYTSLAAAIGDANAIVCATGARDPLDPLGPLNVDLNGTLNLIEAAKKAGVKRFVLVSSIGADTLFNPLNLFGGVLLCKQQAELALARSGLEFIVVRPGGLRNAPRQGETGPGAVVMAQQGTYGFPPQRSGSILRSQVADVCLEALVCDAAINKVVEVIAEPTAPQRPLGELFASIKP